MKIKIRFPGHYPPASSKAQYQDLMDLDVISTFKIKIKNGHHIKIKIKTRILVNNIQHPLEP